MRLTARYVLFLFCLNAVISAQEPRVNVGIPRDLNALVLRAITRMPRGGDYSVSSAAHQALRDSMDTGPSGLTLAPQRAQPSYCSGATYLVLLQVFADLERSGGLQLGNDSRQALLARGQSDGVGVWGRWNANGPGTARLFAELGLGRNFVEWEQARPGDFMKIWWSDEIGKFERGHSVIYLGRETVDGVEQVRFWSSNKPGGYGIKVVPRAKIAWALFSRLEKPEAIVRAEVLPSRDAFLANMLRARASRREVLKQCRAD